MPSKTFVIPASLIDTFVFVWNSQAKRADNHKDYRHKKQVDRNWINAGWCYQFALVLRKVYGKKVELWSDTEGGHCWIKVGNLFYDSNHPHGVPRSLTMNYGEVEGPISIKRVGELWNRVGSSGPVNARAIADTVRTWKRNNAREAA